MRRNPCVNGSGEIIATEVDSSDGWIVFSMAQITAFHTNIKRTRKFEIDQLASRTFSVVVHHGTSHILLETWSQDGATNSYWMDGGLHRQRPFTHQAPRFQHCSSTTFDMPRRGQLTFVQCQMCFAKSACPEASRFPLGIARQI